MMGHGVMFPQPVIVRSHPTEVLRFGVAHVHTVNVDRARFFVLARKI